MRRNGSVLREKAWGGTLRGGYKGWMEVRDFFDKALLLQRPWFVRSVRLDLENKSVELEAGHRVGARRGSHQDSSGGR